jgi:hypothetical protein
VDRSQLIAVRVNLVSRFHRCGDRQVEFGAVQDAPRLVAPFPNCVQIGVEEPRVHPFSDVVARPEFGRPNAIRDVEDAEGGVLVRAVESYRRGRVVFELDDHRFARPLHGRYRRPVTADEIPERVGRVNPIVERIVVTGEGQRSVVAADRVLGQRRVIRDRRPAEQHCIPG